MQMFIKVYLLSSFKGESPLGQQDGGEKRPLELGGQDMPIIGRLGQGIKTQDSSFAPGGAILPTITPR